MSHSPEDAEIRGCSRSRSVSILSSIPHESSPVPEQSLNIVDSTSPEDIDVRMDISPSGSEQDAEGTEDDSFGETTGDVNAQTTITVDAPTPSESASSTSSRKRKLSTNDDDVRRIQEAFGGLRRSVRESSLVVFYLLTWCRVVHAPTAQS